MSDADQDTEMLQEAERDDKLMIEEWDETVRVHRAGGENGFGGPIEAVAYTSSGAHRVLGIVDGEVHAAIESRDFANGDSESVTVRRSQPDSEDGQTTLSEVA